MRLYQLKVEIFEAATNYAYPVVTHVFTGRTEKEARAYHEAHRRADAFGQVSPSSSWTKAELFGPWLHVSSHRAKVSRTNSTVGRTNWRLCCSIACLPSGTDR